jgi:two-component system, NarL family, response regulator LiaR
LLVGDEQLEQEIESILRQLANERITARQLEILQLLAQGKSNLEMAHELAISAKTVEKHVTALSQKLKVASRVGLAIYAVKAGLI